MDRSFPPCHRLRNSLTVWRFCCATSMPTRSASCKASAPDPGPIVRRRVSDGEPPGAVPPYRVSSKRLLESASPGRNDLGERARPAPSGVPARGENQVPAPLLGDSSGLREVTPRSLATSRHAAIPRRDPWRRPGIPRPHTAILGYATGTPRDRAATLGDVRDSASRHRDPWRRPARRDVTPRSLAASLIPKKSSATLGEA